MELDFWSRIRHGWNAFMNKDPTGGFSMDSHGTRPDRRRLSRGNERSIVNAIFNRIALDVSSIDITHCQLDEDGRYKKDVKSALNECLQLSANLDQTSRAFLQDAVISMMDEGVVAIVPISTTADPALTEAFDIGSLRTGKILEWKPNKVKVRVYNEKKAKQEDIWCLKRYTAIVENPFFSVVNEPNSTMQRLIRKLSLLDITDEQTASGKLDLIIQLPYTTGSPRRKERAEERRKEMEEQLSKSKYGVAYADGTERIVQLNRSLENNLLKQIEYLQGLVYSQIGITQAIMDGTADEKTMQNYFTRVVEPILAAIVDEMKRKFLSKTARSQNKSIEFFRDPLKLVPVNEFPEMADKLTRNEIVSKNEIRQKMGFKPSDDPKADQLINSNISQPNDAVPGSKISPKVGQTPLSKLTEKSNEEGENQNG